MTSPRHDRPSPPVPAYQVFGIPAEGDQAEHLLKTFEQAEEAEAFIQFLSAGGQFLRTPCRGRLTARPTGAGTRSAHERLAEGRTAAVRAHRRAPAGGW